MNPITDNPKIIPLVLHLSHSDIARDPRILRSIRAVALMGRYRVRGIGISSDSSWVQNGDRLENEELESVHLRLGLGDAKWKFSRRFLGRGLRRFVIFVGLNVLMLWKSLRSLRGQRVVGVHVHDSALIFAAFLISILKSSVLVYDAHELESERSGISPLEGALVRILEKLLWSRIDALVTVSPGIARWYETEIGPKPFAVVLNSPATRAGGSSDNAIKPLKSTLGLGGSQPLFVYVGLFTSGRGIETMLEVFSSDRMRGKHIVFIGDGPLRTEIDEKTNLCSNIHRLDPVPNDEVVETISTADFGIVLTEPVSLSYTLSLPNKLFELAMAGLPLVASNMPEIEELVIQHGLGITIEPSVEGLFQGINDILLLKPSRTGLPPELSPESQAKKLQDLYEDILSD